MAVRLEEITHRDITELFIEPGNLAVGFPSRRMVCALLEASWATISASQFKRQLKKGVVILEKDFVAHNTLGILTIHSLDTLNFLHIFASLSHKFFPGQACC